MDNATFPNRILIVGGGTAGWMTALYLGRVMRRGGCQVTLVESADIGTIGVGEATVPTLVHFFRMLGLNEHELMRRCSATYKLAIRFEGWNGDGHAYYHPFGGCGHAGGFDLFQSWLKRRLARGKTDDYAAYAVQTNLAAAGLGPTKDVLRAGAYAYHLDADALAQYLKELAIGEGVRHLFGSVGEITRAENGDISSVEIGGGRTIEAGLFIDATGFRSRLIETCLGDPWIDWSSHLLCDRAVAMPLPPDEAKPPFTRSIAARGGWIWRIPLNNRTGTGYVFSSAHVGDEEAVDELVAQSDLRRRRTADPRFVSMRVGRRTSFWKHNCVAIGLASGFVEPLESTGIHLIQKAVLLLAEHFPSADVEPAIRTHFNVAMGRAYDEVRDFVLLHYVLARRDEPFWRDARNARSTAELDAFLDLYDVAGIMDKSRHDLFQEPSYHSILDGLGRRPRRPVAPVDVFNMVPVDEALTQRRTLIAGLVAQASGHDAMLAHLHRRGF